MGGAKRKPSAAELERIYDDHAAAMFGQAMALLRDETAVRDILQDVFLKLAEGRVEVGAVENQRAYLLRMVHHAAIDLMRRSKVRADHAAKDHGDLLQPCADPDREAFRQRLEEALAGLPPEQREVVVLKLWQERTFGEISDICGIPMNTAASRYRYALDKLRNLLRPLYEEL
ncbi:MAG: sigma-70 family RNA polymerase sigma factor [Verrucomicrobiaceae bacterium]|nr:MAG: sigma-70 family RNA polymerase sigma factor [Verrucomicrobiaceae bacterium]